MKTFDSSYIVEFLPKLLPYLPFTLEIWLYSVLSALLLGALAAFIRIRKIPFLHEITRLIVSYVRGTPVISQLFLVYFGLRTLLESVGFVISSDYKMVFVILTYGLNMGAAVSENLRAAFDSVDKGQLEAAYSIGMTKQMTFMRVLFPQAMTVALPNFSNILVAALKNTSLAFSVGVIEMMKQGQMLGQTKQHFIEAYIALAIIYYLLYLVIVGCFRFVDFRVVHKYETRGVA
jgi:L-cystine transport system permease protein